MTVTRLDPCLICELPDCDDTAKGCGLRVALRRYYACRRNNLPISDDVRREYSLAWREIYHIPWRDKKSTEKPTKDGRSDASPARGA